jgi:hypothetical protein
MIMSSAESAEAVGQCGCAAAVSLSACHSLRSFIVVLFVCLCVCRFSHIGCISHSQLKFLFEHYGWNHPDCLPGFQTASNRPFITRMLQGRVKKLEGMKATKKPSKEEPMGPKKKFKRKPARPAAKKMLVSAAEPAAAAAAAAGVSKKMEQQVAAVKPEPQQVKPEGAEKKKKEVERAPAIAKKEKEGKMEAGAAAHGEEKKMEGVSVFFRFSPASLWQ